MILRLTNRMLAGAAFLVAAAIVNSVLPSAADSFDKNMDTVGTGITRAPSNPESASAAENTSVGNAVWATPLSKLSMTRDRPIFSPSRRPPPTPPRQTIAKSAEPTEPERPPLTLVGTVAGENSGIAVFVEQTTEKIVSLHMNEGHQGWILRSIQGREVTLQNGRKSSVLALAPPGASLEPARAQVSLEPTKRPPRR
jgi:hypothetical protein